jgi:hypothetical protein
MGPLHFHRITRVDQIGLEPLFTDRPVQIANLSYKLGPDDS